MDPIGWERSLFSALMTPSNQCLSRSKLEMFGISLNILKMLFIWELDSENSPTSRKVAVVGLQNDLFFLTLTGITCKDTLIETACPISTWPS